MQVSKIRPGKHFEVPNASFWGSLLAIGLLSVPGSTYSQQISPNPNPLGNSITTVQGNFNSLFPFQNFGSIFNNSGVLFTNSGALANSGTLTNKGTINNGGDLTGYGLVTNGAGGVINNTGVLRGAFDNAGTINNSNLILEGSTTTGVLTNTGVVNNQAACVLMSGLRAIVNANGGTINNAGNIDLLDMGGLNNGTGATLNNSNRIDVGVSSAGGKLQNDGQLNNSGLITASNAGLIAIGQGGALTNKAGSQGNLSGNIAINSGASLTNAGTLINEGTSGGAGQISVAGLITNSGTLQNQGQVSVSGNLQNSGMLQNQGAHAALAISGTLTNNAGGTLENSSDVLGVVVQAGGVVQNNGNINNSGHFGVTPIGVVSGSGNYIQTAGGVTESNGQWTQGLTDIEGGLFKGTGNVNGAVKNQGAIQGAASGLTLTGAVSGAGNYQGIVTFTGSLNPDNSPALITGEHLIFGTTNHLNMELGGHLRGSQYDAINANQIDLNGVLSLSLINLVNGLFDPSAGDYFDLLIAQDLNGDFSAFDFGFAQLDQGLYWTHQIFQLANGFEAYRLVVAGSGGSGNVPEPGTLALAFLALTVMAWNARRYGKMASR